MENFQTVVKNILKRRNITVYKLAEITGIERSHLVKILNGQRNITIEKLNLLIEHTNLTSEEADEIKLAYIDMNFGIDKFNEYSDILICENTDSKEKPGSNTDSIEISVNFTDNITEFNSHTELIKTLYAVTTYEMQTNGKNRIYTNIDTSITSDIFGYVKEKKGDIKDVDIVQIASADSDLNYSEIIKTAVNYMSEGYKMYYSGLKPGSKNGAEAVFPFYFITDTLCVFVNEDLTCGFAVKSKKIADIYVREITAAASKMTSIILLTQDVMEIKNIFSSSFQYKEKTVINLNFFFCAMPFMTLDMGYQITKPELPNCEYLIDVAYKHYQAMKAAYEHLYNITSYEGMRDFTDFGMVSYIPKECIVPLKPESRIEVYKNAIKYYSEGDHYLYISKPGCFKNKIDINLTDKYSDRKQVVSTIYGFVANFVGNSIISVTDTEINNDLADFCRYLTISPYFYSREESLDILSGEIKRLEYMTENNA